MAQFFGKIVIIALQKAKSDQIRLMPFIPSDGFVLEKSGFVHKSPPYVPGSKNTLKWICENQKKNSFFCILKLIIKRHEGRNAIIE